PAEVRVVPEVRLDEVRAPEVRLEEERLPEARPGEVRAPEVRPPEVRSAEVRPAEVRPPEVHVAEVRADVGVLVTPRVPRLHAFLEQRDVLVVCHESTSNSGAAPNDSTLRTGVPKTRGAFRRRPCSLFSPHVAAYFPDRLHRAVPSHKDRQVALRQPMA